MGQPLSDPSLPGSRPSGCTGTEAGGPYRHPQQLPDRLDQNGESEKPSRSVQGHAWVQDTVPPAWNRLPARPRAPFLIPRHSDYRDQRTLGRTMKPAGPDTRVGAWLAPRRPDTRWLPILCRRRGVSEIVVRTP